MVVSGKKNLKPGRSMTMSPGSRNSGRRRSHCQVRPATMNSVPRTMSRRLMGVDAR
jgi:hypothetical protein